MALRRSHDRRRRYSLNSLANYLLIICNENCLLFYLQPFSGSEALQLKKPGRCMGRSGASRIGRTGPECFYQGSHTFDCAEASRTSCFDSGRSSFGEMLASTMME